MCLLTVPKLLFYTHIPTLLISIVIAFFIVFADKKNAVNRNLGIFIGFFCFWVLNDMLGWMTLDLPRLNLFLARISILEIVSLYFFLNFTFSFVGKKVSLKNKFLFFLPFLPVIILTTSNYNVYELNQCQNSNGPLYFYAYFIALSYSLLSAWLLGRYFFDKTISKEVKNQIKYINFAIIFVVFWFAGYIIFLDYLNGIQYQFIGELDQFMPIGVLIFLVIIAYAITKYQFLKIKLLAAQALTYAIWLLISSQYFFADDPVVRLLITLTLVLSVFFGFMLIKSVKEEAERKEQLQVMADKLASANDQLRKLDNAKTEFISIASHQLRTPITAIKGFASLLLEGSYGELSEGVKGAMEKVYSSSERLVALIEDLLNVSRIESGRMQFSFEKANVEKLIKELYDNFILIAKTKGFFLEMKMPEVSLPEIVMDYTKIRELVSNFVDNALKYTEHGGVVISAEMRDNGVIVDESGFVVPDKKSEYGKVIRITVKDTGIGIPKEEIPYLFKKFSRGKDVSRLHVGGTGLGLYVGKAIAEAHHGQVWVESEGDGKGSSFIIEIPVEHV